MSGGVRHIESADVTIVGGGIIGLAAAYELARSGVSVVLIEKDTAGTEQSSRNWGYTRQQARHAAEVPLAVGALKRWPLLAEELGEETDWVRSGNLIVTADPAQVAGLHAWAQVGKSYGVPTRVLVSSEIASIAPFLRGDWLGGMYTSTDGHANPVKAVAAYQAGAVRAGVRILDHCVASGFVRTVGAVTGVETSEGSVLSPTVIVAAGAWSRRLLRTVGINLPVQWVRASVASSVPTDPLEGGVPVWAPDCAFRQALDGRVIFAPEGRSDVDAMLSAAHNLRRFVPLWAHNLHVGFRISVGRPLIEDLRRGRPSTGRYDRSEPKVNTKAIDRAHVRLGELVPQLRDVPIERTWAGYIDGTSDGIPVISRVDGLGGLVIATGFSGHGFGIAPAAGEAVAALVTGAESPYDLRPFSLDRFQRPPLVRGGKIIE